jgi:hypothetical protein
MKKKQ